MEQFKTLERVHSISDVASSLAAVAGLLPAVWPVSIEEFVVRLQMLECTPKIHTAEVPWATASQNNSW